MYFDSNWAIDKPMPVSQMAIKGINNIRIVAIKMWVTLLWYKVDNELKIKKYFINRPLFECAEIKKIK